MLRLIEPGKPNQNAYSPELAAPEVVARVGQPVRSAEVFDRDPRIVLRQESHNLCVRVATQNRGTGARYRPRAP